VQRNLCAALLSHLWPTTALYVVGFRGSGKSSFMDAVRLTVGSQLVQVTSQTAILEVDKDNFGLSAGWPTGAMLLVDEFAMPEDQ